MASIRSTNGRKWRRPRASHRRAGQSAAKRGQQRRLAYESLEDRRLLAVQDFDNGGFEFGNPMFWGTSGGSFGMYSDGLNNRPDPLHHEDTGQLKQKEGFYFGALTIPRPAPGASTLATKHHIDLQFNARAGDRVEGWFSLIVGANAPDGSVGEYARLMIINEVTGALVDEQYLFRSLGANGLQIGGFHNDWQDANTNDNRFSWIASATGEYILRGEVFKPARSGNHSDYRTSIALDGFKMIESLVPPTGLNLSSTILFEDAPVDTTVGTFSTIDPDFFPGDAFQYALVSGTGSSDNAKFRIVGNQLRTNANLNFETDSTISIRVRTTDNDGLSFEREFSFPLRNVAPTVTTSGPTGTLQDNQVHTLSWSASDPNGGPFTVTAELKRNGVKIDDDNAATGSFQIFPSMVLGDSSTFTVDVTVRDLGGLTDSSSKSITIHDDDTVPPVITLDGSGGTQTDADLQEFTWFISDNSGIASAGFSLKRNGSPVFPLPDLVGSVGDGKLNFDTLGPGFYEFTVSATDRDTDRGLGDRLSSSKTRTVTVADDDTAAPAISFPDAINQLDSANNIVSWSITDPSGISSRRVVLRRESDNAEVFVDTVHNAFSFDLNGLGPNRYRMEARATDADNDWTGDNTSVLIVPTPWFTLSDDDTAAPSIELGGSNGTQTDDQPQAFTWSISDASGIADRLVKVTRNGSIIFSQNASDSDTFAFDTRGPGEYVIEVSATDADTDWGTGDRLSSAVVTRSVIVSDDDSIGPTVEIENGSLSDGGDNFFYWNISDPSGIHASTVKIWKDGVEIYPLMPIIGPIEGSFDLNSYGSGTFTIEVDATDNDSDHDDDKARIVRQRTIVIADDDTTAPTIDITSGSSSDGENNFFEWNVTDSSGVFDADVRITRDEEELYFNTFAPTGLFNLNTEGLGEFTIKIDAIDDDNDAPGDRLSATATQSTAISDDDTDAPEITLDGSSGSQSHGVTQAFTWSIADASGLTAAAIEVRKNGTAIFSSTTSSGSFNFDSHGLGSYELIVSATDADEDWLGDALSAGAMRNVVVTNASPEAQNDEAETNEDTAKTIHVLTNDADADPNEILSVASVDATGALGLVTINADNTISYDPQDAFQHLAAGEPASDSFSYTISDGFGGTATALVTVTITGNNDAPVAEDGAKAATEDGGPVGGALAADDVDSDDDPTTLSYALVSGTSEGTATVNADGTYSFDPGMDFQDLAEGETRDVSFTFQATDSHSAVSNIATVTVTVTGVNDAPVAVDGTAAAIEDGGPVGGAVVADDVDSDDDPMTLTYALVSGTSEGAATVNPDGTFSFDPGAAFQDLAASQTRQVSFTFQATDSHSAVSNIATVTVTVTGVNDAPVAVDGTAAATEDGVPVAGVLVADDVDSDDDGSTLNYALVSGTSEGTATVNPDGTFSFDPGAAFQDLAAGQTRQVSFTFQATDGHGAPSNTATVTITVTGVNDAPVLNSPSTIHVEENAPNGTGVGALSANDSDQNHTLTFSIIGGTGANAFVIDPTSGVISVVDSSLLDYETTPTLTLDVKVTDEHGDYDSAAVAIQLLNQASISGVVFIDVNQNGAYDANEPGVDGVAVELLDGNGNPALDAMGEAIHALTSDGGFYLFEDLDPEVYQLREIQPTGVDDGAEMLGSLGGAVVANDVMQLTLVREDAFDYAFAELGQQLSAGDTANNGFWQNKHGQALIAQGGVQLAQWLTENFGNVFGNSLVGADGQDVADFYREQLFKQKGKNPGGPAKVDAQFMAVALATFFTSRNLAGEVANAYGFNVTDTGIGTKIVNVGANGAAFGVENGVNRTILQLLYGTNDLTDLPDTQAGFAYIYDTNGDGMIDSHEAQLRDLAHNVFAFINGGG